MCHSFVCTALPCHCSLPDPRHIQREWGNGPIARHLGGNLLPISSTTPSNTGAPTPKHPPFTTIHDSDLGRAPSYPPFYDSSSTNISDAKSNLKTILANRVSFNDPNIVDVLIKPDEVNDHFVKYMKHYISKDEAIMGFLTHLRCQAVLESEMHEPLVGRNYYPYFEYS